MNIDIKQNEILSLSADGLTLSINKVEIFKNIEFKNLINLFEEDKGNPLHKKQQFINILFYIYLMEDPRSVYYSNPEKEKQRDITRFLKLNNFTEPKEVTICRELYRTRYIDTSPNAYTYLSANLEIKKLGMRIKRIGESIDKLESILIIKLEELDITSDISPELIKNIQVINNTIKDCITNSKSIRDMIKEIPSLQKSIVEIYKNWVETDSGKRKIYGSDEDVYNREV